MMNSRRDVCEGSRVHEGIRTSISEMMNSGKALVLGWQCWQSMEGIEGVDKVLDGNVYYVGW